MHDDGLTDLVIAAEHADTVWLLPGDGLGGFGPPTPLAMDQRQRLVALGDFDGDGIDAQAVADQFATGMTVLFGDGTGGFHATAPEAAAYWPLFGR